eukprot:TRINITY_DN5751_c0_g1_i1.p1 TRINITY_DN5751_c0_g1~~TRINITY_DN5751_c0_g1_i1.p1  ORF type:complete len:228 (+),score=36.90 TRINITY_DN5751_c0_g1_i1:155-838(+)
MRMRRHSQGSCLLPPKTLHASTSLVNLDNTTVARLAHKHNFRYGLVERWMRMHKKDTVTAAATPPVVESEILSVGKLTRKSKYMSSKSAPRKHKRTAALDLDDIFNPKRRRSLSDVERISITPPQADIPFTPIPTTSLHKLESWNSSEKDPVAGHTLEKISTPGDALSKTSRKTKSLSSLETKCRKRKDGGRRRSIKKEKGRKDGKKKKVTELDVGRSSETAKAHRG